MSNPHPPQKNYARRQLLTWGLIGLGLTGTTIAIAQTPSRTPARIPPIPPVPATDPPLPFQPMTLLRDFEPGTLKQEGGRRIREFEVTARSTPLALNSALSFMSWNLNDRVPAPTLRAQEGDRLRIIFHNEDGHSHSLHFHGLHPADMDGIEPIRHGKTRIYEFDAGAYGLYPYHCHIAPVTRHIGKGLYGLLIIDPKEKRPPADELVMVMGGYDLNDDQQNELYAFNGIPNYYRDHPIQVYQHQLIRLYLLNMVEFDPPLTFHLHANLFQVYRSGRSLTPTEETDVITLGTAERHILEFRFPYPGSYMFHPHQDSIAERGCMGRFDVLPA